MIKAIAFDMMGVVFIEGQLNRELVNFIEELKLKYKVALLTNYDRATLDKILEHLGINGLFDVVVASSEAGYPKPHPYIYKALATKLNMITEEIVFIDDLASNVEGAEAAGMQALLYETTEGLQKELELLLGQ